MATVELIPPPEPEKQVVITLSWNEALKLTEILGKVNDLGKLYDRLCDLGLEGRAY